MCLNVTTTNKRSANMNITTIYHTMERKKNYWLLESAVYLMFWVIFAQLLCQVRYGRSYAKMFDTQCSNRMNDIGENGKILYIVHKWGNKLWCNTFVLPCSMKVHSIHIWFVIESGTSNYKRIIWILFSSFGTYDFVILSLLVAPPLFVKIVWLLYPFTNAILRYFTFSINTYSKMKWRLTFESR